MNVHILHGCTSRPLASYLKALGVLRLTSTIDADARGWWSGEAFAMKTNLSMDDIVAFFIEAYVPSVVLAPWNGGSGFYDNDNKEALAAIASSTSMRLVGYRQSLAIVGRLMDGLDRDASPKNDAKVLLVNALRAAVPDAALEWLDAAVLLSGDSLRYPPLLGTGGNDGRLDFTNNFMQRLLEVIPSDGGQATTTSRPLLLSALLGMPVPGLARKAIGQFAPGQVGGPNATTGFDADSLVNPWDFVLMIEGVLPFASAAVRRNADDPTGVLSYPFTVRPVGAGAGALGEGDAGAARGEIWMPLWGRPAAYPEVRALLAEGRVALGRSPARDALDFARGIHRLGGYRGVGAFERYGFLMRSGKAFLATPLSRVRVTESPQARWLDDLDNADWLARFRRFAQGDTVAVGLKHLRRRLEDALFELSGRDPSPGEAQGLLRLLADIQSALASSRKAREASLRPIPLLSGAWVTAADDGSMAYRIARAVASLKGERERPLPIRSQLYPVHPRRAEWLDRTDDAVGRVRLRTEVGGSLTQMLTALLARRLWLGEQLGMSDRPLDGVSGIDLDDLSAFLESAGDDARIASLIPAFSLCVAPDSRDQAAGTASVPAAVALLRVCMLPELLLRTAGILPEGAGLPTAPELVPQLVAGNVGNRAVETAWRRLRGSGLAPVSTRESLPRLAGIDPTRAAASLLIPLRFGAAASLARQVLKAPSHTVA